ncbi:MAG: 2-phosphosulfolactate phosphatase [bacterium]|nr:2-phosphosulfolactate phosphatase [bacterium]
MFYDQGLYNVRCEWGIQGVSKVTLRCDAVVIVDVLSFSTCVEIAVSQGALVYPHMKREQSAEAYAESLGAVVASRSRKFDAGVYSLAPSSLVNIPAGTKLVLPSPNGSMLSMLTGQTPTFAACLRNARAVAEAAAQLGTRIAVIPAGERWEDSSLRPSLEDWLGAGAVVHHLPGTKSPEAMAAEALYLRYQDELAVVIEACSSGRELIDQGFAEDVALAAALNVSTTVPRLIQNAYQQNTSQQETA